ncbi:CorA family divalent cation transporter [uncultured Ilyobacter sp.]|uniref:CorA family divalent cation transporter n=1 Tax=uncultured Ilyobacter sp. TaxID=544433 RepID=UPI0029C04C8F|nr:CorA family divalent cation transporter [uncultured Ilyobacter sp.]
MIEVLLENGEIKKVSSIDELVVDRSKILSIQLMEASEKEIGTLAKRFDFLIQPLDKRNEIEISSRYVEINSQIFLNLTFPNLRKDQTIEEAFIHVIILKDILILNLNGVSDISPIQILKNRIFYTSNINSDQELTLLFLSSLTDYYADLIELVSKKVKRYFKEVLDLKNISVEELDNLTKIKLDNIQLKECLIELQRIILQLRRSPAMNERSQELLISESKDLSVINGHINYNFDRLNDLKDNISSKIELEQNHIIKIFTVVTVCIAPPSLIAGIYGMNFDIMPELGWNLGYPFSVIIMILSIIITLVILKFKKWI